MERHEADSIARKLATSWARSSIAQDSWADEIIDLQRGPAEEAARRLVRQAEHAPSIAQFHGIYRALLGSAPDNGPLCPDCLGSGLVTDTRHPQHWPGRPGSVPVMRNEDGTATDECICNVVRACTCKAGADYGQHVIAAIEASRRKDAA